MYTGKTTAEIKRLEEEYKKVIGIRIDGELGFEIYEDAEGFYISLLKECIKRKIDAITLLQELEARYEQLENNK